MLYLVSIVAVVSVNWLTRTVVKYNGCRQPEERGDHAKKEEGPTAIQVLASAAAFASVFLKATCLKLKAVRIIRTILITERD